jgi:hypothetical protein
MTAEALALIASYFLCSEAAEVRVLDRAKVEACATIYTEVKLGFLTDIEMVEYQSMNAVERADANRRGYTAYVAWRVENADLVAEMEAEARIQLSAIDS